MKKITFIAIMAALPMIASAQKWGLEQCINYALDHNIQVQQSRLNVDVNSLNVEQAKFNYLPSLNASAGYNISFGRSLDQTTYQYIDNKMVNSVNGSLSIGTQLFAGMTKLHSLQKSKLNLMASVQDTELLKNNISLSIAGVYLQILYNKEQITTSQNQIKVLQEQLERTKKLVAAGSVAMGAQLDLESQLTAEQFNLVTYQNNHNTGILDLTQLLELKNTTDFDIQIPDVSRVIEAPIVSNIDDINELAQNLPEIQSSEFKLRMSKLDVKLAQASYYPTLSFGASYGSSYSDVRMRQVSLTEYEYYPFFDQFADNASTNIQFSMQVPIFNGLTARRNVKKARIGVSNSELALQSEKNTLYKKIQQAHNEAEGALSRYNSATSSVKSSTESFRYAEQKFSAGAINAVDYLTAKNNLMNSQSAVLQAKYEYVFRIKILDFYKGIPLTL